MSMQWFLSDKNVAEISLDVVIDIKEISNKRMKLQKKNIYILKCHTKSRHSKASRLTLRKLKHNLIHKRFNTFKRFLVKYNATCLNLLFINPK